MEEKWKEIQGMIIQQADKKTGTITVENMKRLLTKGKMTFEEECEEVFKVFDYDDRGFINKPKLKVIAQNLCKLSLCFFDKESPIVSLEKAERS